MNRRMVLLNLALLALVAALIWTLRANWLEARARERAVLLRTVPPQAVLAPPSPPAIKAAAPGDYIDVANKMLFSKDRNPTVVVEPPKPPPEPVMPALPNYHGQIAIGEPVILLSTASNVQRSYHAGDQVGDFKLISFDQETAVFEWKGKNVERKLEEMRPKQVLAQASPNAAPAPPAPATQTAAPARPVSSLDRPAVATPAPAASATGSAATGKAVTSLSGAPASSSSSNSTNDASADGIIGAVLPGGFRACVDSDNSPAGTVHSGYRKVQVMSIFGASCDWEPVR